MRKLVEEPMRKLVAAVIAVLMLATLAPAQRKRSFKDFVKEPLFALKAAGDSFDIATSMRFDGMRIREANPLLRRADGKFSAPRGLLLTAGFTWLEFEAYKRSRKTGVALLIFNGALRGFVGAYNLRLLKRR
ncbi:MAG TPA: hypothetical protein VF762_02380 [Blastocatellia bacterium]|jgi:hypothetical protein